MNVIAFWKWCLTLSFYKWGHWNPAKEKSLLEAHVSYQHSWSWTYFFPCPSQCLCPKPKGQPRGQHFQRQGRPDYLITPRSERIHKVFTNILTRTEERRGPVLPNTDFKFLKTQIPDKYTHSHPFPPYTSHTQSIPCALPSSQGKRMGMLYLKTSSKKKRHHYFPFWAFFSYQNMGGINFLRDQNICWRRNLRGSWQLAFCGRRRWWCELPFS